MTGSSFSKGSVDRQAVGEFKRSLHQHLFLPQSPAPFVKLCVCVSVSQCGLGKKSKRDSEASGTASKYSLVRHREPCEGLRQRNESY